MTRQMSPSSHSFNLMGFSFVMLIVALTAVPVLAHAILVESSPKEGEVLKTAPKDVVLRFNARIEKKVTRVTLLDGAGQKAKLPSLPDDDSGSPDRLIVLLPPLKPSAYRLEYRVLAADGHSTPGLVRFTVSPPQTQPSGVAAK